MATELDPVLSFRAAIASEIICNQTQKKLHLRFRIEFANIEQKPAPKPIQHIPHHEQAIKQRINSIATD